MPHIIPQRILICTDTYQLICGLSYGPEAKSLWFRNNSKILTQKNQQEILLLDIFLLLPTAKVEYLLGRIWGNSRTELLEIEREIDDIKKKSITYSNDFIRISSANLSMSVVHPLHQSKHSKN